MKTIDKLYTPLRFLTATVINIAIIYVIFMACRIIFYIANSEYFPNLGWSELPDILSGALVFDTAGIIYVNILYVFLMLIPLPWREGKRWQITSKWIFVLFNSATIIANIIDTVYFRYTNRRTTASIFSEFGSENNIFKIIGEEASQHYILLISIILMIAALWILYCNPYIKHKRIRINGKHLFLKYLTAIIIFAGAIILCIAGIRGGFAHSTRPITIGNANQYVNKPIETAVVLNTPFSIIRTIGKKVYKDPHYFQSLKELERIYTPVHKTHTTAEFKPLNVVVIILESFGQEYIDYGYAPFIKSLREKSLWFKYSFSNGRKSIDAMPSVLSGIPMFIEPYFVTHYATNNVSSIAGELKKMGYNTSFFHGAPNGSMGFQAFSRTTGWDEYYGMTEYNNDSDFDGMWAIWDEPFMQFFAKKLNEFKEPFASTIFTASSHHPFKVPNKYINRFKEEGDHPILKCVRYTDYALQQFFEKAKGSEWYKNTLFIITGDHTNATLHEEFITDAGIYRVPIMFYYPGGDIKGCPDKIAQQTDIMPTVLSYLNYNKPYIAFGKDLLDNTSGNWAINYNNGSYQYFDNNYLLQFDGTKPFAVYDYVNDPLLKENILNETAEQDAMTERCKAIIQQYIERMTKDRLTEEE
ncbi:MAG: sulfatase-like hydrolase/transferase [Bacteroidales bacterium]